MTPEPRQAGVDGPTEPVSDAPGAGEAGEAGDWREPIAVALAAAAFAGILITYMMLRGVREALILESGTDTARDLFTWTMVGTLLVVPLFSGVASRTTRRRFVAAGFLACAAGLAGTWAALALGADEAAVGRVYYVLHSVSNLFAVGLFWGLAADLFGRAGSRRAFGRIAAGGTVGAIAGPWLGYQLGRLGVGVQPQLLVGTACLSLTAILTLLLQGYLRRRPLPDRDPGQLDDAPLPGGAFDGFRAMVRHPLLPALAAYVLILAVMGTFLYFTRLQVVERVAVDTERRRELFNLFDAITQAGTLLMQLLLTGWVLRRVGRGAALAALPLVAVAGFAAIAASPTLMVLLVVQTGFKGVQRAVQRPARESIFASLPRADRYKAKSFLDTFVYRFGDVIGARTEGLVNEALAGILGVAMVAIATSMAWGGVGLWIGRRAGRLDAHGTCDPRPAAPDAPSPPRIP